MHLGVTKEAYYDICEALGSDPVESEIPIDFDDLFIDVQEALGMYHKLRDEWDVMNGRYLGKSYAGILDLFTIQEVPVEDRKTLFNLINIIDKHRAKILADITPKTK